MEAILFIALAAVIAVVGVGLGLAVAPRLSRWDERRSGAEDGRAVRDEPDEAGEGEGEVERE